VEDNGRGIDADTSPHMGWLGMRERITALGGQLAIGSGHTHGVRLDAQIPLGEAS
jgi:signal transduction histidine kinase